MWERCSCQGIEEFRIQEDKKQKIYRERDKSKTKIFIDQIKYIPLERLVFVDESGFDKFLYREYGRSKKGEKIIAEVSGRKFEKQSAVAAKCGNDILAPFGYSGTCCNAELFNLWQKCVSSASKTQANWLSRDKKA